MAHHVSDKCPACPQNLKCFCEDHFFISLHSQVDRELFGALCAQVDTEILCQQNKITLDLQAKSL